ncbi:hypothetical protein CANTEDRAFT_112190 [Yamadazyma tenuis ATCC 10573]|uniref:Biogenesis of lysosome-related organelles complex 1 subunit KXD1 n=2 Tax=Candida tenuis (strain ATCC 10573 / BCRC 21748 / CBS 615 / JCM 9827 / NBRC 10315 / NRRL Y-1498 / VKM Y-70) TaxID=590646 RepID=G3AW65_CANTC|nr:uncharacterized protein CANTEDRAFT_112190 [Yamadazyma tenuis ATCC 10573]EGV66464.1 hypothetical protein CANTEDRAFT_112190 [Yamadazyma tenuis ATCC 10573]
MTEGNKQKTDQSEQIALSEHSDTSESSSNVEEVIDSINGSTSRISRDHGTNNHNGGTDIHSQIHNTRASEPVGSSDEDDYLLSDDNVSEETTFSGEGHRMGYNATLSERADYLAGTLDHALDSLELDKSLVVQAQLSGMLNNENQNITEKRQQILEKLKMLQDLLHKNFEPRFDPETNTKISVVQKLNHDIKNIETRIRVLKEGRKDKGVMSFLGNSKNVKGVMSLYPIEYSQARDKVLERQIDEDIVF